MYICRDIDMDMISFNAANWSQYEDKVSQSLAFSTLLSDSGNTRT